MGFSVSIHSKALDISFHTKSVAVSFLISPIRFMGLTNLKSNKKQLFFGSCFNWVQTYGVFSESTCNWFSMFSFYLTKSYEVPAHSLQSFQYKGKTELPLPNKHDGSDIQSMATFICEETGGDAFSICIEDEKVIARFYERIN